MATRPEMGPSAYVPPDRPSPRSGAEALLWAVLVDGIETYCRGILDGATDGLAYREAELWIFAPNLDGGLMSFSNVCEQLDVDVRRLRRALLRFRDDPTGEEIMRVLRHDAA